MRLLTNATGISAITCILVTLSFILPASGVPLDEHVPDNALVYIGWAGTNNLQKKYNKSNIKKIIDSSNIDKVFTSTLPQIIMRLSAKNSVAKRVASPLESISKTLIEHPFAVYIAAGHQAPYLPAVAIISRAGSDANKLVSQWQELKNKLGMPVPTYVVKKEKDIVVFATGKLTDGEKKILGLPYSTNRKLALPLSKSKSFVNDINSASSHPAFSIRINMARMWNLIENLHHIIHHIPANSKHDANMPPDPKQIIKSLGLSNMSSITLCSRFAKQGWETSVFVNAPAPRQGLLSAIDKPVNSKVINAVPKSAEYAKIFRLDIPQILLTIKKSVKKNNPRGYKSYKNFMHKINEALGASLAKEILPALGNKWALYLDKHVGGTGASGMVAVGFPEDVQKAEETLNNSVKSLIKHIRSKYHLNSTKLSLKKLKLDNKEVYSVQLPLLSPSWTVRNGKLYVGLFPQTALVASEYKGKSIAQNKRFNNLYKKLNGKGSSSIEFFDLPSMLKQSYSNMLILEGYIDTAKFFGIKTPQLIIPPLNKLRPIVSPALSSIDSKSRGIKFTLKEPFPGSLLIAFTNNGSIQQLLRVGLLSRGFYYLR